MKTVLFFILILSGNVVWSQSSTQKSSLREKVTRMQSLFQSKNQVGFLDSVAEILSEDEDHLKTLTYLSLYHINRNQLGLARIIIDRILAKYPRNSTAYNNRGFIALKDGKKDEAVLDFVKSLDYNSTYFPALVNLSSIYMESLDYQQALPLLKRAYEKMERTPNITTDVNYVKIVNNYAVSLVWAKNTKTAREVYRGVVRKNQVRASVLINYARFLIESLNNISEARDILKKASFLARSTKDRNQIDRLLASLKEVKK